MALTMPPAPWQIAANEAEQLAEWERWVNANKDAIADLYERVAGFSAGENIVQAIARGDPHFLDEYARYVQYDQYRTAYISYFGEEPPVTRGAGAEAASSISAFYERLEAGHGSLNEYANFLDARRRVDTLAGTEAGREAVRLYGYANLTQAYAGRQDYQELLGKVNFFLDLDPLMRREFGRAATRGDVERVMSRWGTTENYQSWLGAGHEAAGLERTIRGEDLTAWGAPAPQRQALQQALYQNRAADLQARIEESRARRKAAFTPAESSVASESTKRGRLRQPQLY